MKRKILFIVFATFLIMTIFSIKVNAANFSFEEQSLDVRLNATSDISFSGGEGEITWKSDDDSIASVNNGTVIGNKIGKTNIKATRGGETATCEVNVVYSGITIVGNRGNSVSSVNLIIGEHDTENLIAEVEDGNFEEVSNASVTWISNNPNTVTVDKTTGKIKAVKQGKATITASVAGASDTCEVIVYDSPKFTDFSNASYETALNWTTETLQIKGIKLNTNDYTNYYYIITSNNTKPNITKTAYGSIDTDKMKNVIENFSINTDENYIYTRNISKYAELNQDMYIWILQESRLGDSYYDENGNYVSYATRFVSDGKKITRAELPKLNLILQTFSIGYWNSTTSNKKDNYTYINFNFPTEVENRKFTLKIGKITDNSILSKIQKNDYSGITELLNYAKSHDSIYSQNLTTTSEAYFESDKSLFDGKKLLQNKGYYYIYVKFDDENGKYYPIEGVTLGQAWLSSSFDSWDLWAYTSSDFKWDNLSSTSQGTLSKTDDTVVKGVLPHTGVTSVVLISFVSITLLGIFLYKKYKKYKDIK